MVPTTTHTASQARFRESGNEVRWNGERELPEGLTIIRSFVSSTS
jgi:hypothetical protein